MAKVLFRDVRSGKRRAAVTDLKSITRQELEKTIDERVKPALVKSHEVIVKDWKRKPDFDARKYIRPELIAVSVFPTGPNKQIWIYVDEGTKPHVITPKQAPRLVFQWGGKGSYVPKTLAKPARTVSGGGRVKNARMVYAKKVQHPGTEAREFTKTIAEDIEPGFKREIENAFRRAAAKVSE
jgi:hypothetical protein